MRTAIFIIILTVANMSVINKSFSNDPAPKKVAILVYEGVYLLDFAGPLEVFNDAMANDTSKAFEVFLVSPDGNSVKCHTGAEFTPNYSIDNCPVPDILVIPGGNLRFASENPAYGNWIKTFSAKAEITMSVCTGAFILAELNMLDGMEVVTWYGALDKLAKMAPKAIIKKGARFTDNGSLITTAGVSAGIDGALHIVEKLYGREAADNTAKYIEYERR